jgi:hypothetical protein
MLVAVLAVILLVLILLLLVVGELDDVAKEELTRLALLMKGDVTRLLLGAIFTFMLLLLIPYPEDVTA